jgi:ABC-type transport system involved in multi-copper enzyme maturation permease subunit
MLSVLLWKEYREHRLVWTVLAFIEAAVLSLSLIARWLGAPPGGMEGLCFVAVVLVGIYALVCGAMMLAGEHENGTLAYLDALPGFRRRLWQCKFVAGVVLVLGQIALLMILGAPFSLFKNWNEAGWTLAAMLVTGIYGLSWGMLFSSLGRSVINMILLSVAALAVLVYGTAPLALAFAALTSVIYGIPLEENSPGFYWVGILALVGPVALVGSALVFTGLDRRRLRNIPKSMRPQRSARHPTWSMLFWLTWRQARGFAAGLAIFALFLGFVISLEPVLLWPAATLIVGVLCGATAFADEQQGSFRFLADQRFPLGRVWVVKVGVRFGIAVAAALLVLAPSFIAALANIPTLRENNGGQPYHFFAHLFHSDLLVNLCPPGLFLTLWLVYGFSSGCLFGLLFRRGLSAGIFALFTALLAAALWIPSLLGGGLHAWQVFGPPVLLLIASRLLMRPWAANRIASWTTALRLTPFVALAGLWIAGGLWYRVLEIPKVSPTIDVEAFRASLPETNESGGLFHSACLRFRVQQLELESQETREGAAAGMSPPGGATGMAPPAMPGMMGPAPMPAAPKMMPPADAPAAPGPAPMPAAAMEEPPAPPMERARNALEHGWPADDKALAVWLDKLYAGEWASTLKKAADLPTSPFDDVRNMTWLTGIPATTFCRDVVAVLAVRGLQRQASGDDAAYVENLRIGLALSRSLRDHTADVDLLTGRAVEGTLLTGLDRWLEKLHGKPDLIRQALAVLSSHLNETAEDGKDREAIVVLIGKNTVDNPLSLQQTFLSYWAVDLGPTSSSVRVEAALVATAWLVPWEHARQDRIFRALLVGRGDELWLLPHFGANDLVESLERMRKNLAKPGELCDARVMQLKLALRWYQADNGKPAETLEELVPKYLPSIPLDPYGGEPFHYRLSRGEVIVFPVGANTTPPSGGPPPRKIPPGQGVLSSVGEGRIFLVPLPPQAK